MQPATSALHAELIELFTEFGGYDAATLYISTPERDYRVNGLKNAANILLTHSTWTLSTKHLEIIASRE